MALDAGGWVGQPPGPKGRGRCAVGGAEEYSRKGTSWGNAQNLPQGQEGY